MSRNATAIPTSHSINANASRVIDSTDDASSDENAAALTRGGFNTGVPRLWCAIATRSVAIAGEKFHEIQMSGFTMKAPPLCRRYFRAPMERLGGKPSQDFVGSSHLLGVAGKGEFVYPPYVVGTVKDLPLPWGETDPSF